jgi:hypothetical protein
MDYITIKDEAEEVGLGSMAISIDSTRRSPSLILKENGVTMVSANPAMGMRADDSGVSVQGNTRFSSSGKSVSKGNYIENDNSGKPYTYTETVHGEGSAMEAVYTQLAKQGIDTSLFISGGIAPIVTDIAPGPMPHSHTITAFKHIHKIEPAYLYKVSPILVALKNTVKSFQSFLSLGL